eukprot:CAMPEP_0114316828 /NCGR_PEP_ID=MMETSP0059-20121206/23485_1 /TAXON_ID=36894 /ORGANISM="Pyramimonas parkeae, Strain CCMP726" /LENGTH=101 /DNA_ID=CAMNT_0001442933 /DNA_START=239 /DNA_END=544 /DNA_ORIENTATION=-
MPKESPLTHQFCNRVISDLQTSPIGFSEVAPSQFNGDATTLQTDETLDTVHTAMDNIALEHGTAIAPRLEDAPSHQEENAEFNNFNYWKCSFMDDLVPDDA